MRRGIDTLAIWRSVAIWWQPYGGPDTQCLYGIYDTKVCWPCGLYGLHCLSTMPDQLIPGVLAIAPIMARLYCLDWLYGLYWLYKLQWIHKLYDMYPWPSVLHVRKRGAGRRARLPGTT